MKSFKFKLVIYLVVMAFVVMMPGKSHAISLDEVEGKSDELLAAENWETREVNASKNTMKCGFWSILVSTVWRGYGHYCIGDDSSHYKLLAMEGASLVLLASSFIAGSLSNDDVRLTGLSKAFFHYGITLFIASYIFDVLGTFKGNTFNLPANHLDPFGHSVDLQLRWVPSDDFNLGLQLGYTWRNPRMWVNPYGFLDVIDLNQYSFGLDLGVALWYGEHKHTYVALAVDTKFEDHLKDKYRSLKVLPYIEFSLDLGSWFDHLAEIRFINRLGVGVNMYDFNIDGVDPYSDFNTLLVLETALSLNVLKDFNIMLTYRYRPDYVVGQISAPSRLFNTVPVPGIGVFSLDLNFGIAKGWYANIEANFGSTIDFWLGASKIF